MKRYLKNFKITLDFIEDCIYDCLDGSSSGISKWKRYDTSRFFAEYVHKWASNLNAPCVSKDELAQRIRNMLLTDNYIVTNMIKRIAKDMYDEITNKSIELKPIKYNDKYDASSGKTRTIGVSSIKQQIYDYIAVNACKSMFNAKIGKYQCASIKYRGQIFGKSAIETWIRTNPKKCKWVFKCDIHKFYPSVNHQILKSYLKRDIKNDTVLYILNTLIDTYNEGLCIGSYLSQYLANYLLSYAYHYVSENLYVMRRGKRINLVNHVLFYMDDILLLGSSKKNVKIASKLLDKYLKDNFKLEIKPNYQLFPLDSRPIDMMGFRIYTYKTTVRKRIFIKANKVFLKVKRNGYKLSLEDAYKVISYNGYIVNSWSNKYKKKMKLDKILKNAKEVISNETKKRRIWF